MGHGTWDKNQERGKGMFSALTKLLHSIYKRGSVYDKQGVQYGKKIGNISVR